jgi:hypothetical protein
LFSSFSNAHEVRFRGSIKPLLTTLRNAAVLLLPSTGKNRRTGFQQQVVLANPDGVVVVEQGLTELKLRLKSFASWLFLKIEGSRN